MGTRYFQTNPHVDFTISFFWYVVCKYGDLTKNNCKIEEKTSEDLAIKNENQPWGFNQKHYGIFQQYGRYGVCQEIFMFLCHRSWDLETMFKVFMGLQPRKHGKPKWLTQYVDSLI